jgi:hypothetical protein
MLNTDSHKQSGDLDITHLEQQANGLTLHWSDGHQSFFHAIWLRDCCYCDLCGDSYSSKRFVTPGDIPLDIRIGNAGIDPLGRLSISWQPDGHESCYDSSWLRQNCYDDASRKARFQQPVLWSSDIAAAIPSVELVAAQEDESELLSMYRKLRDFGLVRVTAGRAEAGGVEPGLLLIIEWSPVAWL